MALYNVTLLEPHRVKSVWRRGSERRIMGSVRQNTPLHSQPVIAAMLRQKLDDRFSFSIVDCRLRDPEREEAYKEVPYGDGVLEHHRVGMSLEGPGFETVARESDVLGITVNFTQAAGVAFDIAKRAKALNPRLSIVYGGADARARYEHYLTRGAGDAVVLGDGERCGADLIRALVGHGKLEDVSSIAFAEDGRIRVGQPPLRETVPMEEVPLPAFDLVGEDLGSWVQSHEGDLPPGIHPPLAYVETSRGCHETCPYCYSAGLRYRFMPSHQIEEYCDHLLGYGIRTIMMIADNELTPMLIPKVRGYGGSGRDLLLERYEIFQRKGLAWEFSNGLQYSMFYRDGQLDEELIERMFSGCYRLFTPIEDPLDLPYEKLYGSPGERRRHVKTADEAFEQHHMKVLARIAATGLPMMTFGVIIGWPGDTVERVIRVRERCRRLAEAIWEANPSCQLLFTPFVGIPIPGTKNWEQYGREGLIREDVELHPEAWQFCLTTYGNFEMVEARLRMIADLDGEQALEEWTSTGVYPRQAGV